ncbi:MAG: hypothetical protein IKM07_03540 [Clostridia bacterium]|nr:hypothetical protein [Clostridia bacterium]
MCRVSIPINCDKFHRTKDKQLLLDELRAFDADRVMLNFETVLDGHVVLADGDDYQRLLERMREACVFFKQHGYEVGAWFWGLQFDKELSFVEIKTLTGRCVKRFACPTDANFLEVFAQCLRDIAGTGVDIILLNDDLRFGAWGGFGCICENHRKMICREVGEEIEEERLKELILSGGQNKYRDALLHANRASLENYAIRMRQAVDEVNPDIRLGFCACMTSWDIDGDAFELARLFAGRTKPILRLIGAPYWSARQGEPSRLQAIVEMERMEASWNPYPDIELIAEGDVYPRPRLNCAAGYLEGFDTALRASGALDGILRICMDYVSNVGYENGYLKQYLRNKPIYRDIETHFNGKQSAGIRIYESQRKVSVMRIPNALGGKSDPEQVFYSSAARILSSVSIPTVYDGRGVTAIAFGENAYELTEECFERGMILDALAAKILTERGFDVGVDSFGETVPVRFQYFDDSDNYIIAAGCSAFELRFNPGAEVICRAAKRLEEPTVPFCYRYENAKGQRFLVFNCNGKDNEMLLRHHGNAKVIADHTEWLSGEKLPAFCYGNPNLYIQCKEDAQSMVIGIWNFFEDTALEPVIELGQKYKSAEFLNGSGTFRGDFAHLTDIPPFGFRGIVLTK